MNHKKQQVYILLEYSDDYKNGKSIKSSARVLKIYSNRRSASKAQRRLTDSSFDSQLDTDSKNVLSFHVIKKSVQGTTKEVIMDVDGNTYDYVLVHKEDK